MRKIGKIYAISGIDGSGKSTCAEMIKSLLELNGAHKTVIVDAMQSGEFINDLKRIAKEKNDSIRNIFSPATLNVMWLAELVSSYEYQAKKLSEEGYNVIFHRSELCCRVYSKLFDPTDLLVDRILDLCNLRYDMQIHLKIDPAMAYQRIIGRSGPTKMTQKETLCNLITANKIYSEYLQQARYKNVCFVNSTISKEQLSKELEAIIYSNQDGREKWRNV